MVEGRLNDECAVQEIDDDSFASRLKYLLDSSGLSAKQIGKLFGVTKRSIDNWLCGDEPSLKYFDRLTFLIEKIIPLGSTADERRLSILNSSNGISIFHRLIEDYVNLGPVLEPPAISARDFLGV